MRNVVREPDPGYPWPVPFACFALFTLPSANGVVGTWCPPATQRAELGERHWWPLVDPDAQGAVGHGHP